jgi:RimJ/RimL family protein N-acetyltransferase
MRFDLGEWTAAFRGKPPGTRWWLRGLGASMWPLLSAGDALEVERLGPEGLRGGELAVLADVRGAPVAHLVRAVSPLRTAGFLRPDDGQPLEPLGRVRAVQRGPVRLPVGAVLGRAAVGLHGVLTRPQVMPLLRAGLDVAGGPATLSFRERWVGPLEVRRLRRADLAALVAFLGRHPVLDVPWAAQQLDGRWQVEGWAAGAVDVRGALHGLVFVDSYREEGVPLDGPWVRALFVDRWARGRGVGRALVGLGCAEHDARGTPRLYADVRADNAASLRLLRGLGFVEDAPLTARLAALHRAGGRDVVALARQRA